MAPQYIEVTICWIIFISIFLIPLIRKVPLNTVVIIDRNNHYLKTKRRGFYLLFPTDKVTTKISTFPITRTLLDFFETDDGKVVQAQVSCKYRTQDLNMVLDSLEKIRRSINDIIKSSVHFAISNYTIEQIMVSSKNEFVDKVRFNLINECISIGVELLDFKIYVGPYPSTNVSCFRPHESSCYRTEGTSHSHDKSLMIGDRYKDGPIIYK